jgi:hypothetical protein
MTPTDPKKPTPGSNAGQDPASDGRRGPRPGGHGSYKLGGEPATGHRWHEAPPPPPAPSGRYVPPPPARYDDGVSHEVHEPGDPLHNEDVAHEHSDVNIRAVIASAIILVVVVGVSQVLMWGLFGVFEKRAATTDPIVSPLAPAPATMPRNQVGTAVFSPDTVGGPKLLTNEPMALQEQRDKEQKLLHGYGWINQGGGVAHMPIDEAKKLIAERGLPVREGEPVSPTLGTRLPARGESSGGRIITMTPPEGAQESAPAAPAAPATPGGHGQHGEQPPAKPHGPGGH